MQKRLALAIGALFTTVLWVHAAQAVCPYDYNCLNNPYGAGSPYAPNGMMNSYSQYGSPYSNNSWTNPYATNPPRIYTRMGNTWAISAATHTIQIQFRIPMANTGAPIRQTVSTIRTAQEVLTIPTTF